MQKTCMITGHREIDDAKIDYISEELIKEIRLAYDDGYTDFVSGFAEGIDLLFAKLVCEMQKILPITLEAAIPYRERGSKLCVTHKDLLYKCERVSILADYYYQDCYMNRNRYMVDKSDRVLAVYDGRTRGGTFATINYATKKNREIKIISI